MRKLAAIMFTDIAGYTAAMEADEAEAGRLRERRRRVLQATHLEHGGDILQYSGDGSLSIFDSAVAAVRCAVDIQKALQQAPIVPLRIGIHVGEFAKDEEGIYGHSVNIAARLESLALAGSVFISERVHEDIRNQSDLNTVCLGDFSLKNVENPVSVFAVSGEKLVVPNDDYLLEKGKVEEKQRLHLPPELTSFIGRQEEQETLSQLLMEKRLITLTGPGGIGKSRLVAKVATRVAAHFPDGIYFVALAPISDPGLVPDTIARTLGITVNPQKPTIESLKEHLKRKQLLLILDNFEQITPAAWMVSNLLADCSRIKVFVTSRIPLNIQGEQEFAVSPLQTPEGVRSTNDIVIDQYPSIELFLDRARSVKPSFRLQAGNLEEVASICAGLDGLPLAIELAAARIKLLPPKAILSRLSQRLDLLKGGAADKPPRHQTLRQSIAWSYDLLSAEEQSFFQTLSIFVGGADLEAIEAVYERPASSMEDPFDLLASLINHSLIRTAETEAGDSRFYMLETIPQNRFPSTSALIFSLAKAF